jgi:hypothetical protein
MWRRELRTNRKEAGAGLQCGLSAIIFYILDRNVPKDYQTQIQAFK